MIDKADVERLISVLKKYDGKTIPYHKIQGCELNRELERVFGSMPPMSDFPGGRVQVVANARGNLFILYFDEKTRGRTTLAQIQQEEGNGVFKVNAARWKESILKGYMGESSGLYLKKGE